jgi:ribonuclease III
MHTSLESKIGYTFHNPVLVKLAVTHASYGHEKREKLPHNERLEFLGDAVLQLIISEYLYQRYPMGTEGRLTKMRAHLVNRTSLVEMAKAIQLGSHLLLGQSEEAHGGRERVSNLANAMEALIGAIFLDAGYPRARDFVIQQLQGRLGVLKEDVEAENPKGLLQEKLHAIGDTPIYHIVSETGPSHQKEFKASVEINGEIFGNGMGSTKKEAEIQAAKAALKALRVT